MDVSRTVGAIAVGSLRATFPLESAYLLGVASIPAAALRRKGWQKRPDPSERANLHSLES